MTGLTHLKFIGIDVFGAVRIYKIDDNSKLIMRSVSFETVTALEMRWMANGLTYLIFSQECGCRIVFVLSLTCAFKIVVTEPIFVSKKTQS